MQELANAILLLPLAVFIAVGLLVAGIGFLLYTALRRK